MRQKALSALPALSFLPALPGCAPEPDSPALEHTPDESRRLVEYASHKEEVWQPIVKEFEERTGIWGGDVVYGATSELLERLEQEKASPQADVMFGGGVESLAACQDCFIPYACAGGGPYSGAVPLPGAAVAPLFHPARGAHLQHEMLKVLVVEDEELIRKGIVLAVDWAVLDCMVAGVASNGQEAPDAVERYDPTLIITDLKMPKMDGLEMLRRPRERGRTAHVIILTAYDSFEYAQSALRLGAVDFLLKPFHNGDLEQAVTNLRRRVESASREETRAGLLFTGLKKATRANTCWRPWSSCGTAGPGSTRWRSRWDIRTPPIFPPRSKRWWGCPPQNTRTPADKGENYHDTARCQRH